MKKRILMVVGILALIIALLAGGAMAYAAYSKTLPATITIVNPTGSNSIELGIYKDAECTEVCEVQEFGEWDKKISETRVMLGCYVRNDGDTTVRVMGTDTLPWQVGSLRVKFQQKPETAMYWLVVEPGAVVQLVYFLGIKDYAPLGLCEFEINISALPYP